MLNVELRKLQCWGDMKITFMKNETKNISIRMMQYLVYFILEFLSKVNSFAYNLLDESIYSVYLEISYFSRVESYTDLELHLQFVCFFCNEHLYIDRSNDYKYILQTSKLTVISLAEYYH